MWSDKINLHLFYRVKYVALYKWNKKNRKLLKYIEGEEWLKK